MTYQKPILSSSLSITRTSKSSSLVLSLGLLLVTIITTSLYDDHHVYAFTSIPIRDQPSSFRPRLSSTTTTTRHNVKVYKSTTFFLFNKSSSSSSLSSSLKDTDITNTTTNSITTTNTASLPKSESTPSSTPSATILNTSRFRRLKDRMWVREALEDWTAAEFACSLAPQQQNGSDSSNSNKKTTTPSILPKRAVDFENLLSKLNRRVEEMCVPTTFGQASTDGLSCYPLDHSSSFDIKLAKDVECWTLKEGMGMGSMTYTPEQRDALLQRIVESRQRLLSIMAGESIENKNDSGERVIRETLQLTETNTTTTTTTSSDATTTTTTLPSKSNTQKRKTNVADPDLYVREDGTIDWDGALQDRAALKKFGRSVWARINGRDPETIQDEEEDDDEEEDGGNTNNNHQSSSAFAHHDKPVVTAKVIETETIREKKLVLDQLTNELKALDAEHTALLNSSMQAGSAIAKLNLASLAPDVRAKIRSSDEALERKKVQVSFQTLNYELERIYTYLDGELGNTATTGYIPLQDRLNVAEFGLLESQIETLNSQRLNGEVVDPDVLSVVLDQTIDFKRRLGIDFYVTGISFDQEGLKIFMNDLWIKTKKGLGFYGKGVQLFWDDIVYASSLIGRALTGYILKPREVRVLRRTVKDIITFIPVVIILLIPLSPVGHVLVFGAIQRFFPDFFPSCFTEQRQNLLALYESTEYSEFTIDENWKEKLVRITEAFIFLIVDNTKKVFQTLFSPNADSKAIEERDTADSNN